MSMALLRPTKLSKHESATPIAQAGSSITTLDNGSEHYLHTRMQEELGMRTYFADPYCPWQRGSNESTNGLIRRYFSKGTGLSDPLRSFYSPTGRFEVRRFRPNIVMEPAGSEKTSLKIPGLATR
jgi:transposase InsO family protein